MWDGINRRRFPRADYPCLIRVKNRANRDPVEARTENIGAGGVFAVLEKNLGLFSEVEIDIDLQDNQPPVKAAATVVWALRRPEVKKDRPGYFDTGLEFKNLDAQSIARIEKIVDKCLEIER